MAYEFLNRAQIQDALNSTLLQLGARLSAEDVTRLAEYRRKWNFYEGYHWEDIERTDKTEVTKNYCRPFVNKLVAFELGTGFSIKMKPDVEEHVLPYLTEVWDDNGKEKFCGEFGQMKSVTGDGWIQVSYSPKRLADGTLNPQLYDPYNEYEKGRVRVTVVPSNIIFPEYANGYDKDRLIKVTIMYPIYKDLENKQQPVIYKQVWTQDTVQEFVGQEMIREVENKYKVIPFFHCKNIPIAGRTYGQSDLDDIIPLNVELNAKSSDVSEIIDYHSAPVTIIYGARIGQLEKGANKVWGGLPKDAKVENLGLNGDLQASKSYLEDIKKSMHEVGNVPPIALGGDLAISNTSGVALQTAFQPLLDVVKTKRSETMRVLQEVNKFIILIGLKEGLICDCDDTKLEKWKKGDFYTKDIFSNEVIFDENLPKDKLIEIQAIQLEMKLGLCDREEGMKRLGKRNIQKRISEIDKDREKYPEIYGLPTEEEKEAMMSKSSVDGAGRVKEVMKRPLGTNKAGNEVQVNAGLQNSQEKKANTNS